MAAVEDDEEGAVRRQAGDEGAVKDARRYLAIAFEVDGDDGVVEVASAVVVISRDLATVAGVVEEVGRARFGDEPLHGGEDVVPVWEERTAGIRAVVVTHDDLRAGICRVSLRPNCMYRVSREDVGIGHKRLTKLPHIVDVLMTPLQLMLTSHVIDSDQQRLLPLRWWRHWIPPTTARGSAAVALLLISPLASVPCLPIPTALLIVVKTTGLLTAIWVAAASPKDVPRPVLLFTESSAAVLVVVVAVASPAIVVVVPTIAVVSIAVVIVVVAAV